MNIPHIANTTGNIAWNIIKRTIYICEWHENETFPSNTLPPNLKTIQKWYTTTALSLMDKSCFIQDRNNSLLTSTIEQAREGFSHLPGPELTNRRILAAFAISEAMTALNEMKKGQSEHNVKGYRLGANIFIALAESETNELVKIASRNKQYEDEEVEGGWIGEPRNTQSIGALNIPEYENTSEPVPETNTFPTPKGTKWNDVKIILHDDDRIAIKIKDLLVIKHYAEIPGFRDSRSRKPNKQWELLCIFTENKFLKYPNKDKGRFEKRVERLGGVLREYFCIPGNPIIQNGGYQLLLQIDTKYTRRSVHAFTNQSDENLDTAYE